jgi:hypothetical protein
MVLILIGIFGFVAPELKKVGKVQQEYYIESSRDEFVFDFAKSVNLHAMTWLYS